MDEIKAGDIVELKTGSVKMTVESISTLKCHCIWYSNNEMHKNIISIHALKKVSPQ